MSRPIPLIAAALLAAPVFAEGDPVDSGARSFQRQQSRFEHVWFLCDGIDQPVGYAVGRPNARARASVTSYAKPGFRAAGGEYVVGNADPGAGQINFPLFRIPRGSEAGSLHAINPGVLGGPADVTTPTFTSITLDGRRTRCRWQPRTRLLAMTSRRSVMVRREAKGGYLYESFDHAAPRRLREGDGGGRSTVPTLSLSGGTYRAVGSRDVYSFRNAGFVYTLTASRDENDAGMTVAVTRGGRPVQTETAAAYTIAAPIGAIRDVAFRFTAGG